MPTKDIYPIRVNQYWDTPVDNELEEEQRQQVPGVGKSKCELLYGPYPPNCPIPKIDKKISFIVPPSMKMLFDIPIDYRDAETPDNWIPRDGKLPRLLRNSSCGSDRGFWTESILDDFAFVTSPALHYVRNHHPAVPRVEWGSLQLTVAKAFDNHDDHYRFDTKVFNMDDILSLRPRKEFPVTLVSGSFRAAELNALRSTNNATTATTVVSNTSCIGTQIYKGVYLRSLLKRMGITRPRANHWVVAKGSDGYQVSIPLSRCIDEAADVLLSYVVNGEPLHPDHGYPLRLVVPGWIGAYSVKWLQEIIVTDTPVRSPNHCVVPPQLPTSQLLTRETWLLYRMTELNLQCVMTVPKHGHVIRIPADLSSDLTIGGFAFAGGGRRVTRVEISLDGGASWRSAADLQRRELATPRERHWCWTWWKHVVRVDDELLKHSNNLGTIRCRAWDDASNTQPEHPTWNACGVGANHEHVLQLTPSRIDNKPVLQIQHPVAPTSTSEGSDTNIGDGWMASPANLPYAAGFGPLLHQEEVVIGKPLQQPETIVVATPVVTTSRKLRRPSMITVEVNLEPQSLPLAEATPIDDELSRPPLPPTANRRLSFQAPLYAPAAKDSALADCGRITVRLQNKTHLSRDILLLDFALPSPNLVLGLPIGMHVLLAALIDGGRFSTRPYTPISSDEDKGRVQFVVKVYRPNPRWPKGGRTSQCLDRLQVGDSIDIRGPIGNFQYLNDGDYSILEQRGHATKINMVAGGSGITPMMQLAAHIIRHPEDPTALSLVYAARDEDEIILKSVLDQWEQLFSDRFRVHYILSDSWPSDWKYSTGFVDASLFAKHLFPPDASVLNVVCGPPIFATKGCVQGLEELGHQRDAIHIF